MQVVDKMTRIGVESAFEVLVKARALEAQGTSMIHLEIGEPDSPTPRNIVEAGKRALDEGWTKYGATQGLPELRQSIRQACIAYARNQGRPPIERNALPMPSNANGCRRLNGGLRNQFASSRHRLAPVPNS